MCTRVRISICALVAVCIATPFTIQAQGIISIGGYIAGKGGWNTSLTGITRGEFLLSSLPDIAIEGLYSLNQRHDATLAVAVGLHNFAIRTVSYNPFSGGRLDDFQLNTQLRYLGFSAGVRFLRVIGLPSATVGLRLSVPLGGVYECTTDVFELNGEAKPSNGSLSMYRIPAERLFNAPEMYADLAIVRFDIGAGTAELYIGGSFVMGGLFRRLPLSTIPPNFNLPGDPLAGLRTLNLQPTSVTVGIRYALEIVNPIRSQAQQVP
jgi:hypothetical protein